MQRLLTPKCRAASAKSTRNRQKKSRARPGFFWLALTPRLVLLLLQLELRGQFLLRLWRNRRVVAEFNRVCALPSGHRAKPRLIARHFGERDEALDRHQVAARRLGAGHLPALAGEAGGQVAAE